MHEQACAWACGHVCVNPCACVICACGHETWPCISRVWEPGSPWDLLVLSSRAPAWCGQTWLLFGMAPGRLCVSCLLTVPLNCCVVRTSLVATLACHGCCGSHGASLAAVAVQPDVDKLVRQLYKLVFVESVKDLTPEPYVSQELVLVKVSERAAGIPPSVSMRICLEQQS